MPRRSKYGTPEWRRFEEIVARVEQSLVPTGATVKSPDRVRDMVTGRLREVDAAIRIQVGSAPVLITIECRKRRGQQDDTWIEQLATKRAKIGAAKTIAVSATGFSESATKTAAIHGIELRTMTDRIGEEIVQEVLSGFAVSLLVTDYRARSITYVLADGRPLNSDELTPELLEMFDAGTEDKPIAVKVGSGAAITLKELLFRGGDHDVPPDGTVVTRRLVATFPPATVVVATTTGKQFLSRIEVIADYTTRDIPAPATALHEYSSEDAVIRRTLEATAKVDDDRIQVLVDFDSPSLDKTAIGE